MSIGITSLKQIDLSRAKQLISTHLYGDTIGDDVSADCALLRSCIWGLSHAAKPVHVLRILNLAMSSLVDSSQDLQQRRARLREALEELSDAGDAVSLPEGFWLPAAVRLIHIDSDLDESLLVGGLPTSLLPGELKRSVTHHGPYRRIRGSVIGNTLKLPKESWDQWARSPSENLEDWAEQLLDVKLEPYIEPQDGSHLRIYAPELANEGSLQTKRWFERPSAVSGRHLAMRERIFGVREYRIVELKNGSVIAINNSLAPGDVRRLMYALDLKAGKPVEIRMEAKGGSIFFTLRSELPRSEQRLLGALGKLEVPEGSHYPRYWEFAERYDRIIQRKIRGLGVKIVEGRTRRSRS